MDYLPIIEKPNIFNPKEDFFATANQNVTPISYDKWNAIGFSWSDPYRGDRVNDILSSEKKLSMQDMIDLQVDYFSYPSLYLIDLLNEVIDNEINFLSQYIRYIDLLNDWDNKLLKNSVEAMIYVSWERTIIKLFHEEFVPEEVNELLSVQLYTIIDQISKMEVNQKKSFLLETFLVSLNDLKNKFGENIENWTYGQVEYKHIKVKHPLEDIVNDSIYNLLSFKSFPRGGNGYTPNSTSSNLSQSSGASFRVIIDLQKIGIILWQLIHQDNQGTQQVPFIGIYMKTGQMINILIYFTQKKRLNQIYIVEKSIIQIKLSINILSC